MNEKALVKGALLHDYFLYDWHEKRKGHHFHGFTHPGTALKNAEKEYELGDIERNIISRHMFPLTVVPPMCREAWLVCLADKYCAVKETFYTSGRILECIKKTNNQEVFVLMTERLIVSLFYMRIIVHTSGKKTL